MREFHQKNKKIPRAAHTEKKEATSSSLCSALEKENGQPLAARRPPFVPPVTVARIRWRAADRGNPLTSWPAVPNRTALSGDYFLLARRDEIAQLPHLRWVRPAGVVLHRTSHIRARSSQIHTNPFCSSLVLLQAGSRSFWILAKWRRFLSRRLRSRCGPPTTPCAPPQQHSCPA